MSRAISSNFNALLDSAENPSTSLEHTLSRMREQIRAARQEIVQNVAAEKQLRKKVEDLDKQVESWAKRAEFAVKQDQDDLAREALKQKKRLTAERDRAEALRGEQRGNALEMKRELERMEAKLEEFQAKKGQLVAQAQAAKAAASGSSAQPAVGGQAFAEFRRMEDQVEGVEATFKAQQEVDDALALDRGPSGMSENEVEAKFRALERGELVAEADEGRSDIDDELDAIRKRVRIQ